MCSVYNVKEGAHRCNESLYEMNVKRRRTLQDSNSEETKENIKQTKEKKPLSGEKGIKKQDTKEEHYELDRKTYEHNSRCLNIEINHKRLKTSDSVADHIDEFDNMVGKKLEELNEIILKLEEEFNYIEALKKRKNKPEVNFRANVSKDTALIISEKLNIEKIQHQLTKVRSKREIYMKITVDKEQYKQKRQIISKITKNENIAIHEIGKNIVHNKEKRFKWDNLKIISLNANRVSNKMILLQNCVAMDNPDILLIQETHRNNQAPRFNLPGYDIYEKPSTETLGENGLIIAVKNIFKGTYTLKRLETNITTIKMLNQDSSLDISNVYIPITDKKKEWISKATRILSTQTNSIMIGDWNTEKKEITEMLNKNDIKHRVCDSNGTGTRKVKGVETDRIIDFAVINTDRIEISESYLRHWEISDH